jgi:hypothetical protein
MSTYQKFHLHMIYQDIYINLDTIGFESWSCICAFAVSNVNMY